MRQSISSFYFVLKAPAAVNCEGIASYQLSVLGEYKSVQGTSQEVHVFADEKISISLYAVNIAQMKSEPVHAEIRAPELGEEFISLNAYFVCKWRDILEITNIL